MNFGLSPREPGAYAMSADGEGHYDGFNTKRQQVLNYVGGPGNILHNPYLEKHSPREDLEMIEKG